MTEPAPHAVTLPPPSPNGDAPPVPTPPHVGNARANHVRRAHAPPRAAGAGSAPPVPR